MTILIFLLILLAFVTVVGHVIWVVLAAIIRWIFSGQDKTNESESYQVFNPQHDKLCDLATTERQLVQFYREGKLIDDTYEQVMKQIREERASLVNPPPVVTASAPGPVQAPPSSVVVTRVSVKDDESVTEVVPSFIIAREAEPSEAKYEPPPPPPPRQPRRSFSEVLNSFMEESNIRWGEIIGGLLIIGCSTALVVSLWAQISEIPVLKFLIFTTVTAILFGIGLYTEHRWKLPTTSRGILTIATLLVPLNFLAIAAVSAGNTTGALVIGSELAAPAIFLCLVYFAGRIITPGCAHILSAGVLGSSVGQLLVRHFASLDAPPALLIFLGAFPVTCYVVTVGLALRVLLHDREIDESETSTVFTILGAMSFAALLPFGLLLYKSGPLSLSMMYLAPIVTLWGLPLVATGTILWRRITNRDLVASRTAGTALGILGLIIVLAGMILAWPNPSSIVPAALLNFAIFTALAIALELPVAHVLATICFALAYLVTFHVFAGNITWVNLRVFSLLRVSVSVGSGQALLGAFALLVTASEWLSSRKRERDSFYYLVAACLIAFFSLSLTTLLGVLLPEYHALWITFGLYALGAFWIAWRRSLVAFTWIGSTLLLFTLVHSFAHPLAFSFPWQTALFTHATLCAVLAIVASRDKRAEVFANALNYGALVTLVLGALSMFQTNPWQVTSMQAQRVFWIASVLLVSLWLNRRRLIFSALQIAMLGGLILTVKAALQQFDWYSYLPHAFLHPAALQIQGTVLALFCLTWIAVRLLAKRSRPDGATLRLLDAKYSIDRMVLWVLLGGFVLLAVYGTLSGVTQELAAWGSGYPGFNIAGFPHEEALGLGSWIVLGLLTIAMLGSFRERRRGGYLLGAIVAVSTIVPLLAGRFETQIATATAYRWLAALFLVCSSLLLWSREKVSRRLAAFGWTGPGTEKFATHVRLLLMTLTVVPIFVLTAYPALRAIYYLPVQGPTSGVFSLFADDFSYGLPLIVVALVMIGYALRERLPRFGFYAGAFINATVTLVFLLAVVAVNGSMDRVVLVRALQLNAITFAVYILPWLAGRARWQPALSANETGFANFLLKSQLWLAIVLNMALLFPLVINLIVAPYNTGIATITGGSFLGWFSLLTTVAAATWLATTRTIKPSADALAALLLGLSCLIAFGISGWMGLHVLTVCITVAAWLMFVAAELANYPTATFPFPIKLLRFAFDLDARWQSRCRQLAVVAGAIVVALSVRTLIDVYTTRWWSIGPLLAMSALATALNWKTLRRRYIYVAAVLFQMAVCLWWIYFSNIPGRLSMFVLFNLTAGSLAGIFWLWLELRARGRREVSINTVFSYHNFAAILAICVLALFVFASYIVPPWQSPLRGNSILAMYAFSSVAALMMACVWDRHAKFAVAGLYVLGLIACAMLIHSNAAHGDLEVSFNLLLSLFTLSTALLWHRRNALIEFARQLGIPRRLDHEATHIKWFSAVTIVVVTMIGVLAFTTNLSLRDLEIRAATALAFTAQFLTLALLAEGAGAQRWRRGALIALVTGAILFGWSWLTPGVNASWLNRSVILMLLVFGLTAVYALFLDQAKSKIPEWTKAARACVPWLLGAGVSALLFCLGTEVFYQLNFGAVLIHPLSLVAIGFTLVASVVICVLFAVSSNHDPLGLSERGRTRYVYAAEVLLALLFLHVRLTLPWLFTGFIERYWPLVVMLIAYFGVTASEALRRQKLFVLAHPLERTGAFIPLLPVFGFWVASSEVDFSLLLFVVGGLYGLLSILRRSFVFGILAAIAGNAGLWHMFSRTDDYQFLQHPQLWLVPVALSVLAAAYLNEEKLNEDQMTGVRYLSLVTIYVSSTADIFINGVANSPWLPLILGSFALAGVFAGIILRIRGLLLLGSIFLLLSIVTMIWYASANFGWTWLWYVAGIMTGATIIFMFAVFEKKRGEVLRVVEGLKDWDR